ncbi:uncharacterized protein BX664DRAFT_384230 [Halteromyces radiatus]|uniref:uncharacterized protein n=1 Tax=Halteromyces radiatus TaxID=101107 RepID=UPI00221F914C|nr:uncharacterized protein BX664DRAFT_384230 [Halteromyces radiatus]KAI8092695.1 hypothetical protein BX664DRAFT_384230 [Halteromyces radiatus]
MSTTNDAMPHVNEEHIIPSSSSHSSIKATKTTSAAVSGWIDSTTPPWSNVSFDQLSKYARRASSSSLNLLNVTSVLPIIKSEDAEQRLVDRIHKVQRGYDRTLKLSLNEGSQGLSKISDHIHRRVPQLVSQRQQLQTLSEQVQLANGDLEDARQTVASMERIESFVRMEEMIQKSLDLMILRKRSQA